MTRFLNIHCCIWFFVRALKNAREFVQFNLQTHGRGVFLNASTFCCNQPCKLSRMMQAMMCNTEVIFIMTIRLFVEHESKCITQDGTCQLVDCIGSMPSSSHTCTQVYAYVYAYIYTCIRVYMYVRTNIYNCCVAKGNAAIRHFHCRLCDIGAREYAGQW